MTERPRQAELPSIPMRNSWRAETAFERYLRIDTFGFGTGCFPASGASVRSYDVLRRGRAVAIVLYDPDRDSVVLVEQFRLPALLAGSSPWQIEAAAGMIDRDETPEAVALRETREETGLYVDRRADPDPAVSCPQPAAPTRASCCSAGASIRPSRPECTVWRKSTKTSASS